MKSKLQELLRAGRSGIGRQTLAFLAFSVVGSGLTAVITALLVRELSTDEFGAFTLSKSLLLLVASIFEFGIFYPAARLTALSETKVEQRKWMGAMMVAYLPFGAVYIGTIMFLSMFVDSVFSVNAGHALLVSAPFAFAYPFVLVVESMGRGTGRAYLPPLMSTVAGVIMLAGLAAFILYEDDLPLGFVLALRGGSFIVGGIAVAVLVKPLFTELRARWLRMWTETRSWGAKVYISSLLAMATYNVDVLIVGALADPQQLASYGLAVAGASLIGLPAIALATALYSRMARTDKLDRRPVELLILWGISATVIGAVFAAFVIPRYLNPELEDAAILVIPLGLAATVGSINTLISFFLSARASGNEMRNAALVLFISNLALTPVLVLGFDAMGAAVASFLSMTAMLLSYLYSLRHLGPPGSDPGLSGEPTGVEAFGPRSPDDLSGGNAL